MNRNIIFSLIVVIALGLGLWWFIGHTTIQDSQMPSSSPTVSTSAGSPSPSASPTASAQTANIVITSPKANASVDPVIVVTGRARIFENQFLVQLLNSKGQAVYRAHVMTDAKDAGQFGNFSIKLAAPAGEGNLFTVEAFALSPKGDGSYEGFARVPVTLKTTDTEKTYAAFLTGSDCTTVTLYPRTILKTLDPGFLALNQLLIGPADQEVKEGAQTQIPKGVQINSLRYDQGTLYADFSETLEQGVAGSCRVLGIRVQIESTLKQFLGIKNVVISINGKTEGILQP